MAESVFEGSLSEAVGGVVGVVDVEGGGLVDVRSYRPDLGG